MGLELLNINPFDLVSIRLGRWAAGIAQICTLGPGLHAGPIRSLLRSVTGFTRAGATQIHEIERHVTRGCTLHATYAPSL